MSALKHTRLVRGGKGGSRIHLRGCRHDVNTTPWIWAEGRDDSEWLGLGHLYPCRVCLPDLARRQDEMRYHATRST